MSQAEIKEIYKKILVGRQQLSEESQKVKEDTMASQMTRIFGKYFKLLQDPKISIAVQDEAKRDISKFLDTMTMNADHDVIMALTNMEIAKKFKEKITQ